MQIFLNSGDIMLQYHGRRFIKTFSNFLSVIACLLLHLGPETAFKVSKPISEKAQILIEATQTYF